MASTTSTSTSDLPVPCCGSVRDTPLSAAQAQHLASGFAALADPVRLRLFSLIAERGKVCACDLVEPVGKSQPTISHHLKVLFEAGLVQRERRGTWIWYSLGTDRLDELTAALT
jgi:ArsR family transcriptional regulator